MTHTLREAVAATELFYIKPKKAIPVSKLKEILPDIETALFFAKALRLNYERLSELLMVTFNSSVLDALFGGEHSNELQDYIIDAVPDHVYRQEERPEFSPDVPHAEILPLLWESITIDVAKSVADVAEKLASVISALPSKEGKMAFKHLAMMNKQRPTFGRFGAIIEHPPTTDSLVILDVSGSMTDHTIRAMVDDVVALSWKANASLAIVSNSTFFWEPGSFDSNDVLNAAEFGGTRYETLAPLFDKDWGVVVTIADYDSSQGAAQVLASRPGRIGKVLDLSLVNRPTFLSHCVGQLADSIEPLLVASGHRPVS